MTTITDADREAARALREVLADMSGFWHRFDDDSALCLALARHRIRAERLARRTAAKPKRPATALPDRLPTRRPGAPLVEARELA